ncbi:MAG: TRAM domain-containing protein, partial [Acidobacteriota bacterium]
RMIRRSARRIAISTDVIVGFPGETEGGFEDTLSLLDEVQYDGMFSFKYSARPGTAALALGGEVPEDTKALRLSALQQQQKVIQFNINSAYLGKIVMVLVDGNARTNYSLSGRTTDNRIVNFDGPPDLLGRIVPVEITGFSPHSLKGQRRQQQQEQS